MDIEDESAGVVPNGGLWVSCGVDEEPYDFVIRFDGGFHLLGGLVTKCNKHGWVNSQAVVQ